MILWRLGGSQHQLHHPGVAKGRPPVLWHTMAHPGASTVSTGRGGRGGARHVGAPPTALGRGAKGYRRSCEGPDTTPVPPGRDKRPSPILTTHSDNLCCLSRARRRRHVQHGGFDCTIRSVPLRLLATCRLSRVRQTFLQYEQYKILPRSHVNTVCLGSTDIFLFLFFCLIWHVIKRYG